jgi:phosphatidyl-myo-inositol alpha-mannosyltransferase
VSARLAASESSLRRILITADAVGGVWTYAIDVAAGLRQHGIEVILAVLGPEPSEAEMARARHVVDVASLPLPLDWTARHPAEVEAAAGQVSRLATDVSADLVHLNSPALAAYGHFRVPVVALAHSCVATWWDAVRTGPLPQDFEWRTELVGRGYRKASIVVAPSEAFAKATASRYELAAVRTVHNGRAAPAFLESDIDPKAGSTGDDHAASAESLFALTAGRLWDEGKNVAALDAIADCVSVPVFAAGPIAGPQGARYGPQRLQTLGLLSERALRRLYAKQPIFASPALYEPFGLAVVEAAQSGCPLVLSDIPTFRELWNGAAIFVPARDEAVLASAINELAADSDHRARMGEAARERALRFTPERMVAGLLDVYRTVLSMPARKMKEAAA